MRNQCLVTARELHDALVEVLQDPRAQRAFEKDVVGSSAKVSKWIMVDSLRFMLHIALADDEITQREANIINYIIGGRHTVRGLKRYARKNRSALSRTTPELPQIIRILCMMDNSIVMNPSIKYTGSMLNLAVAYFTNLGLGMMETYGDDAIEECKRISAALNIIQKYAEKNSLSAFYTE